MKVTTSLFIRASVSCFVLAGMPRTSHALFGDLLGQKTKTESSNAKIEGAEEYKGIKHAVGVKEFTNEAGWSGQWQLGSNMSTMLESTLYDSGRFVIVEREKLDAVIGEQNLANSGRSAQGTKVAETGKIRLAKYIATGAITEVASNESGNDGGINIKGFRIGAGGSKAKIVLVVKLVDTTTSEVIAKETVTGEAGSRRLRVGYSGAGFGGDLGGFNKTPLGEAAQDCIIQAVEIIAKKMEEMPLEGSVVKVSESGTVIINRGSEFGISNGQVFEVRTAGEELVDPDTGAILGREPGVTKCSIAINKVDEKISFGKVTTGTAPDRGDTVILVP